MAPTNSLLENSYHNFFKPQWQCLKNVCNYVYYSRYLCFFDVSDTVIIPKRVSLMAIEDNCIYPREKKYRAKFIPSLLLFVFNVFLCVERNPQT